LVSNARSRCGEYEDQPTTDRHPTIEVPHTTAAERILFVPDTHAPFHDVRAFDLMLNAAADWGPTGIVVLGDMFDFYAVSAHSKDPRRKACLVDELNVSSHLLRALESLGARWKWYAEGNHEARVRRYICDKAPALQGMVDVYAHLQIRENGWGFTPYKEAKQIGHLMVTHDLERHGQNAVREARREAETNIVIGHVHRMEKLYRADMNGNAKVAACVGWLGDYESIDYRHKSKAMAEWQHGFGLGYMDSDGTVYVVPVPIFGDACWIEGKRYHMPARVASHRRAP
jgi:UDP-2,3-diacylglucosamine pyrophosphatase LpxH